SFFAEFCRVLLAVPANKTKNAPTPHTWAGWGLMGLTLLGWQRAPGTPRLRALWRPKAQGTETGRREGPERPKLWRPGPGWARAGRTAWGFGQTPCCRKR